MPSTEVDGNAPACAGACRPAREGGMAEPSTSKLHIWEGWAPGPDSAVRGPGTSLVHASPEAARSLFLRESLLTHLRRRHDLPEPYSLSWFLEAEKLRHGRH